MDLAHEQSRKIFSLSAAIQDTIPWDPSIRPQPSDCSPPSPPTAARAPSEAEWIVAGAKPKVPSVFCSSPSQSAPLLHWTEMVRGAKTKSSAQVVPGAIKSLCHPLLLLLPRQVLVSRPSGPLLSLHLRQRLISQLSGPLAKYPRLAASAHHPC